MKSDIDILKQIHEELKKVDHPPFDPVLIDFYGKLVDRFPEDGFELLVADSDLSIGEEQALRLLNRYEYIVADWEYQARDGYFYHVNMRGKRFLELANGQVESVVVGRMHDSGERETFETGAVRDTAEGKPQPHLISPFAIERLGAWLAVGAEKYGPRNWERGISSERHCASLCRHLMKYQQGCKNEDHLAAVFCNVMFLIHNEEMVRRGVLPESLLDMPKYEPMSRIHRNGDDSYDF